MLEEIESGPPAGWAHAQAWAERMRGGPARCEWLITLSTRRHERVDRLLGVPATAASRSPTASTRRLRPPRRSTALRALAPSPGRRAAGLARRAARWAASPTPRPTGGLRRRRPGAALRGPLHGGQARRPADPRPRAGAHALRPARAAGAAGRLPRGMGGRAPDRDRRAVGGGGRVPRRLARATTSCRQFFGASDVVVLPSVREQFGQVLVEGMACGLPAIAVNNHGPAEIVDDGETGGSSSPTTGRARRRAGRSGQRPGRARPPRRARPRGDARALRLAGAGRRGSRRCTTRCGPGLASRPI